MFKQAIALILLVSLSIQTFSQAIVVLNFEARRATIAGTLCINRDKPLLKCCGKCYLKKKLHEEKQSENTVKAAEGSQVYLAQPSIAMAPPVFHYLPGTYPKWITSLPQSLPHCIFQPPWNDLFS